MDLSVTLGVTALLSFGISHVASRTQEQPRSAALVVRDEDVAALPGPECGTTKFLISGKESKGAFALLEGRECGHITGLHRHDRTDETFYVIEGQLRVWVDGQVHRLNPGDYVFIPRGTPHAQGNPEPTPIVFS